MDEGRTLYQRFRTPLLVLFFVIVLAGVLATGLFAYSNSYADRVIPGVHIGNIGIGGMNRHELHAFLSSMNKKLATEGVHLTVTQQDGVSKTVTLYPTLGEEEKPLLAIDIEQETDRLLSYGKGVKGVTVRPIVAKFQKPSIPLQYIVAERKAIEELIEQKAGPAGVEPKNASISISSIDPLRYTITSSSVGVAYEYERAIDDMIAQWRDLRMPEVILNHETTSPAVVERDVAQVIPQLPALLAQGGLTLTHTDPHTNREYVWRITPEQMGRFLNVQKMNGNPVVGVDKEKIGSYFEKTIASAIKEEPTDAKFVMDEATGKVTEFRGSRPGVTLDTDKTYDLVNAVVIDRFQGKKPPGTVTIVTAQVEPKIALADINNLGITEPLGTGVSSFAGSPKNRILNIRNAVKKLNGTLVKPGEEFSTIAHTQPYTLEGGYLPEKVIKGDEIKPEIGGGLCQVGSTLFRMAMNSAMKITERRNHSLVVSYYNDPINNLPGTDATIYEPSPDFKFLNDTGHYILIQTEMREATGDLIFTIWGKNDGRKGSYTRPVVSKWLPAGEPRMIETTKLPPGTTECQNAYRGAHASFTYTRIMPDGTKEDKLYESYYRPLPKICLVGVAEVTTPCEPSADGVTCTPVNPETGETAPIEQVSPSDVPIVIE
ncbi:MAG TPA: VanW family protein [Candidatus Kapabacteria bacterium]|nr:VanW family protein [Candidatus Kapabacteria bacterium]